MEIYWEEHHIMDPWGKRVSKKQKCSTVSHFTKKNEDGGNGHWMT